jgi:hypothetical protein
VIFLSKLIFKGKYIPKIELPDAKTNAGLEVRLFICETRKPHKPGYDLQEAILAMQYMDLVLYNRLVSPGFF